MNISFLAQLLRLDGNSTRKDQRGSFYVSSSNLSAADNLNTLYLYNYVRGQPKNLANVGTGPIYVNNLYISKSCGEKISAAPNNPVTGGYVATGIYSASFALDTSASFVLIDGFLDHQALPLQHLEKFIIQAHLYQRSLILLIYIQSLAMLPLLLI